MEKKIKDLIEDYQRRLKAGKKLLESKKNETDQVRIIAKMSTYRYFIVELERCLIP